MIATDTATMLSPPPSDCQMGLRPLPKSGRKPLQPKNDFSNNPIKNLVPILKLNLDPSNKENFVTPPREGSKLDVKIINIEPFEASLAEELSSIRKKMERLKLQKDETERLLKERDVKLDKEMNRIQTRVEAQKELEIQVDRLFRLKELKFTCMKTSPFRSLREKEEEKKKREEEIQENIRIDDTKSDMVTIGDQNTTMEGQDGGDCK